MQVRQSPQGHRQIKGRPKAEIAWKLQHRSKEKQLPLVRHGRYHKRDDRGSFRDLTPRVESTTQETRRVHRARLRGEERRTDGS